MPIRELCLNTEPSVVGLRVEPSPCDVRATDEIVLRAGSGLLEVFNFNEFNEVLTGPREELLWVRLGQYRRPAAVGNRPRLGQGGERGEREEQVVLLLSRISRRFVSGVDLFDS